MLASFKDLHVSGDGSALIELVENASQHLPVGWTRDLEGEGNLNRFAAGGLRYFVFQWSGPQPPAAGVALTLSGGLLDIANIVPSSVNELSHEEYNEILEAFARDVLRPPAAARGIEVAVSGGKIDIREMLSSEAYRLLETFAGNANKGTGSAHPSDRRRWVAFLVQAKREHRRPSPDVLERWFTEERGWPHDVSVELASEYEFAMDLLEVAAG